ncbi:hypothetical protein E9993_14600 [Labilibacter sediminis]|nr:hypothetical protein E9993_14600 [Labilibacter sediminis]
MIFGYNIDESGRIIAFGYDFESYQNVYNESDPFSFEDAWLWKKDLTTGEWIYLPDITSVDKTITNVEYNWSTEKAYITIADQFRPGPHEFDCTTTWTETECMAAIESKFPTI